MLGSMGGCYTCTRGMRPLLFVTLLVSACWYPSQDTQNPEGVRPPAPIQGRDVDAYGTPIDPQIASCVRHTKTVDSTIAGAFGEKAEHDQSGNFAYCWCRANGFRGQRVNGTCLP